MMSNKNVTIWGPELWRRIHTDAVENKITQAFLDKWLAWLPAEHGESREWVATNPLPKTEQFDWSWRWHDAVNARLGKDRPAIDAMLAHWSIENAKKKVAAANWGAIAWRKLHTAAKDDRITTAFVDAMIGGMPVNCTCRAKAKAWLAANSIPAAEQFDWSWRWHDSVNADLGKPRPTLDAMRTHWLGMAGSIRGAPQNASGEPRDVLLDIGNQAAGDAVLLSAVIRDIHKAHPGRFRIAVNTVSPPIFANNPHVAPASTLRNPQRVVPTWFGPKAYEQPRHLLDIWTKGVSDALGVPIPISEYKGDIHLSDDEQKPLPDLPDRYWVLAAGWKEDRQIKAWPREHWQAVIDALPGVVFVQVGGVGGSSRNHELRGVVNLVGKTDLRQLIRLIAHASGVVSSVSLAMHLSAAVALHERVRPTIVIGGGAEPNTFYQYFGHHVLHSIGALPCAEKACWRTNVVPRGNDHDCLMPENSIAKCMRMIRPTEMIAAIERNLEF